MRGKYHEDLIPKLVPRSLDRKAAKRECRPTGQLGSVHILHGLDLGLRELALVLVVPFALALQQCLPVLVQLQLCDHHLAGVHAHIHCGACQHTTSTFSITAQTRDCQLGKYVLMPVQ